MKSIQIILILLIISFAIDYVVHKYVFPFLTPPPPPKNATQPIPESEVNDTELEDEPQDIEDGTEDIEDDIEDDIENPETKGGYIEDDQNEVKKETKKKRRRNAEDTSVHIMLW